MPGPPEPQDMVVSSWPRDHQPSDTRGVTGTLLTLDFPTAEGWAGWSQEARTLAAAGLAQAPWLSPVGGPLVAEWLGHALPSWTPSHCPSRSLSARPGDPPVQV